MPSLAPLATSRLSFKASIQGVFTRPAQTRRFSSSLQGVAWNPREALGDCAATAARAGKVLDTSDLDPETAVLLPARPNMVEYVSVGEFDEAEGLKKRQISISDDAVGYRGTGPVGLVPGHSRVASTENAAFVGWGNLAGNFINNLISGVILRGSS